MTYEQYSEGFIVAVMNIYVDLLKISKPKLEINHLKRALRDHMQQYLNENGGTTPEGNTVDELVREVRTLWLDIGRTLPTQRRLDQWLNNPQING